MNAGCYGSETRDVLVSAWGLTPIPVETAEGRAEFVAFLDAVPAEQRAGITSTFSVASLARTCSVRLS